MNHSERITYFADVLLPLSVPQYYTYRVPFDLNEVLFEGQRVVVQFGAQKRYTALVRRIHQTPPRHYEAKYIEAVLDPGPLVHESQFIFWEWMASYYCCHPGDVMNAALPGSLKLASETRIVAGTAYHRDTVFNEKEQVILDALETREVLTLKEIAELLAQQTVQPYVKSLLEKGAVMVEEELKQKYKPRYETFLRLAPAYASEEGLKNLFDSLGTKKSTVKQVEILLRFIQLSNRYSGTSEDVRKADLLEEMPEHSSSLQTLLRKEVLESVQVRVDRLGVYEGETVAVAALSEAQQQALDQVRHGFSEKEVVLLHGVTSGGKTEIYIRLIEEALASGENQVLYLLPEIALTTQIINRLRKHFGDEVGIYHSRFNEQERAETWAHTLSGKYRVLLGARSALFLPFRQLGLIIVDEEHENSFKQFDPAPRYHARDSAIMLGHLQKCRVLLGSATPSIESYFNAQQGKYGFATLKKRYGGVMLPEVQCVDLGEATRHKKMKGHFSETLIEHIREVVAQKEQVILFQNRRGYSPFWLCETCGWVPRCRNCDVSLTYHKQTHQLQCHYCATVYPPPKTCSACGSHKLKMLGFGTEKIEEDLTLLIPGIRVARMDLDSTRSKNAYYNLIREFEAQRIDVLVGTQMVTKGLDFDKVALVGVLNADSLLHYPDFRAFERSFQLLVQVSGRAGRKQKRGKVLIQTYTPNHWIVQKVMQNDYENMYSQELIERRNFAYPPFVRLIKITLKHKDLQKVEEGARYLAEQLRTTLGKRVLGPEQPLVPRIRNYFYRTLLLKLERGSEYALRKQEMNEKILDFKIHPEYKPVLVEVDVDPV